MRFLIMRMSGLNMRCSWLTTSRTSCAGRHSVSGTGEREGMIRELGLWNMTCSWVAALRGSWHDTFIWLYLITLIMHMAYD